MSRLITAILLILAVSLNAAVPVTSPEEVIASAAKSFKNAKSVTAPYSMTMDGNTVKGEAVISGDKFRITTPGMSIWYDGRTQWTYYSSTGEVNVTEPTAEELQQINPFAIINSFRSSYKARMISSTSSSCKIEFTPVNSRGAQILKATITFNASTHMPVDIALTLDNGAQASIKVGTVKTGISYPASTFVYDKSKYPNAEIIDLR